MIRRRESWGDSLRGLTGSFADVVRAELALLAIDYRRWGKRLGIAAALGLAAGWIALWCSVLLLYTLVRALETALDLNAWQAPLLAAGLALLVALILVGIGWLLVRRLGSPGSAFRRRFDEHRAWWRHQVLGEPAEPFGGAEP